MADRNSSLSRSVAARRIIRGATRRIDPISNVLASPPAVTIPAGTYGNSTIITTATTNQGGGRFNSENPLHATPMGGSLNTGIFQTITRLPGQTPARFAGHSAGVSFATRSSVFDICIRAANFNVIMYATDLLTGARARVAVDDIVQVGPEERYYKVDFGSAAMRGIEVYTGISAKLFGINVPTTDSVWAWSGASEQPRIAMLWDSYGQGELSDTGTLNKLKLATPDYIAARLGCANPWINALAGTGVVATGAAPGTFNSFAQRVAAGDLDASRVGGFDLVWAPVSVNDSGTTYNLTDATVQSAYASMIAALMAAQPDAIIVGSGPQYAVQIKPPQSRFDAAKAGFLAAAGADPRMIHLDNSLTGENWMFDGINATIIGADGLHPTKVGAQYLGERIGGSIAAAVKTRFSL